MGKKIVLPNNKKNNNALKSIPIYDEKYKKIVEEADAKIMEARREETKIFHEAKKFISTSSCYNNTIYKLCIEDLVGNLFYSLKKRNIDTNQVSYKLVDAYENIIAYELDKLNLKCVFDISRDKTNCFLYYNKDIYVDVKDDNDFSIGIALVNDLPIDYFIYNYQGYLTLDLLNIIINDNTIDQVIDAYNDEMKDKSKILTIS